MKKYKTVLLVKPKLEITDKSFRGTSIKSRCRRTIKLPI
jgi:hypothetical protein